MELLGEAVAFLARKGPRSGSPSNSRYGRLFILRAYETEIASDRGVSGSQAPVINEATVRVVTSNARLSVILRDDFRGSNRCRISRGSSVGRLRCKGRIQRMIPRDRMVSSDGVASP